MRELEEIKSIKVFYTEFASNEKEACNYIAKIRWGNSKPYCPHCKSNNVYIGKDIKRPYKCHNCKVRFSVKTGTFMQKSNVSVQQWLYVMYVMLHNKKGISLLRLSQEVGTTQKTAWCIAKKVRECFEEKNAINGSVE